MATMSPSAALVPVTPAFSTAERLALAGFLAGYRGLTRQAYELDLRQYVSWCHTASCPCSGPAAPTSSASPAISKPGPARATITRRLCTSLGSTGTRSRKSCWIIPRPPTSAGPSLDYESHAIGLDRNELGALLVAAGLGPPADMR